MTRISGIITIAVVAITIAGVALLAGNLIWKKNTLPVLGEPGHIAGPFSFVNQDGKTITLNDVDGKVTVAEYFFTTCPGICPIMNKNMVRVYNQYKDRNDFSILSHTVNPEKDTVPVMAAYATRYNAKAPQWEFLTGDKYALYKAAREDYLLAVADSSKTSIEEDFIHTEFVALLDKQRRIRGFYDATDSVKIDKLIVDIKQLLKE
ncbi:MAG: SCO family protein [Chitinophagaceae bacterium]